MKIQIVKGVYGHKENGITTPKSKNSEPFEVADAKAKELIKGGIAIKYTGLKSEADAPIRYRESLAPKQNTKPAKADNAPAQAETNNETDAQQEDEENTVEYSMKNTKDELLKIAEDLGVEISDPDNTTKQQIIDLLDEAFAGDAPQIGDNEGIVA